MQSFHHVRPSFPLSAVSPPVNFTLGAMRIMLNFSVWRGVNCAVVFVACLVLVASRLVVELLVQHVQVFLGLWFFGFRALHCCAHSFVMYHQFFRAVVFRRFVCSTP